MSISKEVKVAIFAILSIATLYIGFNYLKGKNFLSNRNQFYVIYDGVAGLNVSNPVTINGFSVGRVSDIQILQEQDNHILVELDVKNNIILSDSTVALLKIDLLGSVTIVLDVGNISIPLESGDTLIARVDPSLEQIIAEEALPITSSIQVTLQHVNQILEAFVGEGDRIKSIIHNLDSTINDIHAIANENRSSLKSTLDSLSVATTEFTARMVQLQGTLDKYEDLADSLKMIDVKPTLAKANKLLDSLDSVVVKMNSEEGTIGKLLSSDSLYVDIKKTMEDLDKLLIHFDENPKDFLAPLGRSKKKIEKARAKEQEN